MSFVPNNPQQQLSLFAALTFLSPRKLKKLENSWAQAFSDHVFTKINEYVFAPLYSERTNSRPNAPINVLVGALILKDFIGLTDEELADACDFDFRYQYALHTTSFEGQPVSERTLSRFRSRLAAYELTTGEDLLHKCFVEFAEDMRVFMEIAPNIKRMDSLMVESNIRRMGRLELLYTCLSNLVKELDRDGRGDLISGLEHYADPNDRNRVVYHDSDIPQAERLQKVIDDAASLLPKCAEDYADSTDYQLLERAIREQTKKDDDGTLIPKEKGDGMDSCTLQNPADPDATYRMKSGKEHRGYSANITETVDKNGSVVTDYQYDTNTHSDSAYLAEAIEQAEPTEEKTILIADGAYSGRELAEAAGEKNIEIITTGLTGRKPREILTQFILTEDGKGILRCPEGHTPKSSSYMGSNNSIRVSFPIECCRDCPHREECLAKLKVRTAVVIISLNSRERAEIFIDRKKDERLILASRIRNGVETVPSVLRRKYNIDHMPVRGKLKTKVRFGFSLFALNFSKLLLHLQNRETCRAFEPANG